MKYVLDASVALKWVLSEPDSPAALNLRDTFTRGVHELIAPDTFLAERLVNTFQGRFPVVLLSLLP
jgi:hypothetical protein